MGSPYALSIHHYISTVGSDAGFAALVGLAILALLYFAQARETSSLREQAAQSAERVQQLEARLTALLRGQTSGAVEATPAPASGSSETPLPDERTIATAGRFSASAPASPSASPPAPPRPARASARACGARACGARARGAGACGAGGRGGAGARGGNEADPVEGERFVRRGSAPSGHSGGHRANRASDR